MEVVMLLWCCATVNTAQYEKEIWHLTFLRKNYCLLVVFTAAQ